MKLGRSLLKSGPSIIAAVLMTALTTTNLAGAATPATGPGSASAAMPLAPLDQAVSTDTIRVAGGCGPGWHRGPYGGCRPMFNCPPGWHSGPYGRHCFRNW